jgi:hypothetical protein
MVTDSGKISKGICPEIISIKLFFMFIVTVKKVTVFVLPSITLKLTFFRNDSGKISKSVCLEIKSIKLFSSSLR